jgi:alpha-1,4-digalacturonate transport system permease protein
MAETAVSHSNERGRAASLNNAVSWLINGPTNAILNLFDLVMGPVQRRIGVRGMAYLFVLPNLLIFGIFVLIPMLLNFYYAFTGGAELFPQNRVFIGIQNFQLLFQCTNLFDPNTCSQDLFMRAALNTASYVVVQLTVMVLISLLTALILNRKIAARGFFRSVFFYPVMLSPVVVALIWKWILLPDGLLNAAITSLGGSPLSFLLSADWARLWVIFITTWAQMGFYTLILLAGLQAIPRELYEASAIDGANNWASFRSITLPLLMPSMLVVLVLVLIRAVQAFDQVFPFTAGGPGTATTYLIQYIYQIGFAQTPGQYGLAAAASIVLGIVLLVFTLVQLRFGRAGGVEHM